MTTRGFRLVLLVVACVWSARAGQKVDPAAKKLTEADCERLVKQLASPDKPPFEKSYIDLDDINVGALARKQAPIRAAYDQLSDNIEVALPVLVLHVGDKNFSYVHEEVGAAGVAVKASVGLACWTIITHHVEIYQPHLTTYNYNFVPQCPSFIGAQGGVEKWWNNRKKKSLAELQLEAVEWAARLERPAGFESKRKWARALSELDKQAKQLRESGKPIRIQHRVQFFGA